MQHTPSLGVRADREINLVSKRGASHTFDEIVGVPVSVLLDTGSSTRSG